MKLNYFSIARENKKKEDGAEESKSKKEENWVGVVGKFPETNNRKYC